MFLLYILHSLRIVADELASLRASSTMLRTVSPRGKSPHVTFICNRLDNRRTVFDPVSVRNMSVAVLHKNLIND